MRGVVFLGNRKLEIREFPDPTPGSGDVVLAIKASGMCGSDLHPYRAVGNAAAALGLGGAGGPVIAGHEPCGVVHARGEGVSEKSAPTGARVMNHHYKGCGACKHCRVGWSQLCRHGITVYGMTGHGGHAPYMVVPASTLVPMPDAISFEEGAAISCGTGTAYAALRRMQVAGGDTLAVFGQGPVGLSATVIGRAMGVRVIAVETSAERLKLAREFGADTLVDSSREDPVKSILEHTKNEGADLALDCTGVAAARRAAVRCVKTWGSACYVGEGGDVTLDVSPDLLRRQVTLVGSWTFSAMGMLECARFIADRRIPLERIFSHRWRLEQADEAYQVFDKQSTGKGVFLI